MKQNFNFTPFHYIFYSLAIITGIIIGMLLYQYSPPNIFSPKTDAQNKESEKIFNILKYISDEYVDSVDINNLVEDALVTILLNLDPHSNYIPAEDFQTINEQITGNFEGIGIQFRIENDTVVVIHTIPNGPSEKIGLKSGDRIITVDEKNISGVGITNNEVMKLLRGKKGTKVNIDVIRSEISESLHFTIIRDIIPTYSVDFYNMIDKNTGYIKLSSFNLNSSKEFSDALSDLKQKGMQNLIFDLRGNGGGVLDVAIKIADHFFPAETLLVYTEGLHRKKQEFYSSRRGLFFEGEVAILIDEFSASASEIIAGAIQDNDRGYVVGRRSFGKGLVQEQLSFKDGSAIRITVARYYTPVGRCIQRTYNKGNIAYYTDFYERLTNEYKNTPDTIDSDTIIYQTKQGRILYGGGGIMPDIHIAYPELYKTEIITTLFSSVFQFSFNYADKNRNKLLAKYKNANQYVDNFNISNEIWNEFTSFITNKSKKITKISKADLSQEQKVFIEAHLKANIGRNLFDYSGYFPVIQEVDNVLQKALKKFEKTG